MREGGFQLAYDLADIVGDQAIISATIGPEGEACLLLISPDSLHVAQGRDETGAGSFAHSQAKKSYDGRFVRYDGRLIQSTSIRNIFHAFPIAQPLPNGEVLLAAPRCHFAGGNPEKNASELDRDGNLLRQFVLGDGIQDIQTTSKGAIWVSYFDEGVFGNYGWDEPLGSAGLVCFDSRGHKLWEFSAPEGLDSIADCYAMNVAGDDVWACYYTDFPVVKVGMQNKVTGWANTIGGAKAMAVNEQKRLVALWGGYGSHHSRCVVQEIGEGEMTKPREVSLKLPKVADRRTVQVVGRKNRLHAFAGTGWWIWDLE